MDTHTHLDITAADAALSVADLLDRARSVGVERVVQVGIDVPSSEWAAGLAAAHDSVAAAVAVHPNEVPGLVRAGVWSEALARIDQLAGRDEVHAVGETGLDHFRTDEPDWSVQEESFRAHIEIARRHDRTLVIHDRDAHDDVLRVLRDCDLPDRVVFHCFSGDADMARECGRSGWFVSFAGVVTFRNAQGLRDALLEVPDELILVETDAPFLTPTPHRGRPNASFLMPYTVRGMADVLGRPESEMCGLLLANGMRAFGLS